MKAIILARVSTKEQEETGQSIPAQTVRLTEYALKRGFSEKEQEVFQITESSTKDTRKKFEKIIEIIKKSKEPVALITDTIDCLQRSFRESVILDDHIKEGKLELLFFREGLVIHKD